MKSFSEYEIALNQLQVQGRRIKVNQRNYLKRLEKLAAIDSNTDREFLLEFGETADKIYLERVETDYANLSPGLTLLENLMTTIKGSIEIYQAASDRNLNNTVQYASVGLAVSGVTASFLSTKLSPNQKEMSIPEAFGWSAVSGIVAIAIVLIWKRMRRH